MKKPKGHGPDTYVVLDLKNIIKLVVHFKIIEKSRFTIIVIPKMKVKTKIRKPLEWFNVIPDLIVKRCSKYNPLKHYMVMTIDNFHKLKKGDKFYDNDKR